jgi:2-keto-4-pentenoate hydratase
MSAGSSLSEVQRRAADRLWDAQRTRTPCQPVRELIGADDVATAYGVATANIDRRLAAGARRIGRKIGLTSLAVQRQLGVDQPDFGALLDDMVVADGGTVPASLLLQPKIEAEVAFVLAHDLDEELTSTAQVAAAVAYAVAALEIVDSRVEAWDITLADTVADNASSGLLVLGSAQVPLADVSPVDVTMSMLVNDVEVSTGDGRACLGDPLAALLWLARTARALGDPLRADEVVLSGALGPMVPVNPGDDVVAHISGLGPVRVRFADKEDVDG